MSQGLAVLFSGQGLQHPEMIGWLGQSPGVDRLAQALGGDWRERLNDAQWAACNAHAQILLTGAGVAAWEQLAAPLPTPRIVAGYSVGELPAFVAAGALTPADAMALAAQRATLMDRAVVGMRTGLLSVTGTPSPSLLAACKKWDLEVAIRLGEAAAILGGPLDRLDEACAELVGRGARCRMLLVALTSHTRWMSSAVPSLREALERCPMTTPAVPLLNHAAERVTNAEQARNALARQVDHCVSWSDCLDEVMACRVGCVLEIGPGEDVERAIHPHPGAVDRSVQASWGRH